MSQECWYSWHLRHTDEFYPCIRPGLKKKKKKTITSHQPRTSYIGQYKTWTTDCKLGIKYGLGMTGYKTRTGKYGLAIKQGQGKNADCGLRTGYKIRTTDYFGENGANWF